MKTNCLVRAKMVYIKKLDAYQIKFAFNVTETDSKGNFKFPVQSKCAFVSGHIPFKSLETDRPRVIAQAMSLLRTDNIEFV
jgi:hypothetical protein